MNGRLGKRGVLLAILVSLFAPHGQAVVFKSTGDPTFNTTAPTGTLTNSGWQYEGKWSGALGTPIAPTFFLTAQHLGGTTNDILVFNNVLYHMMTNYDNPNTDLRIWKVAETFPYWAPLYTNSNEIGQNCVVFGRGTQRGPAYILNGSTNGWYWGAVDNVERWGENTVSGIYTDPTEGVFLTSAFERNGSSNECDLTVGDSGGAMFIKDGTTWKLAGIHYSVDGPFSLDGTFNTETNIAVMDERGLYYLDDTNGWTLIPTNQFGAVPGSFYSSRVSVNASWINSVINYEPGIDLCINAVQIIGPDVQISLTTGSNRLYRVDRISDLVTGVWTTVTNNILGTGGSVPVIDPGAATNQVMQFYRATILQ